jgi:hypothetical protein
MLSIRMRFATVVGSLLTATALVAMASPAMASGRSCGGGEAFSSQTCININGTGLKIVSDTGTYENLVEGLTRPDVHIELSGPHGLIKNCPATSVDDGQIISCTWSPNHTETGGDYYATAWFCYPNCIVLAQAVLDVHS